MSGPSLTTISMTCAPTCNHRREGVLVNVYSFEGAGSHTDLQVDDFRCENLLFQDAVHLLDRDEEALRVGPRLVGSMKWHWIPRQLFEFAMIGPVYLSPRREPTLHK